MAVGSTKGRRLAAFFAALLSSNGCFSSEDGRTPTELPCYDPPFSAPLCTSDAATIDQLPACDTWVATSSTTVSVWGNVLAIDDDAIYRGETNAIFVLPRNGLHPSINPSVAWTFLAEAENPTGIALDETHVYFSGTRLSRVNKRGGAVQVLSDRPAGAVTTSGGFIYFSDEVPGEPISIRRWSPETGNELVAELRDGGRLQRFVVDGNFVYTLPFATQPARVTRVDTDDGALEIVVPRIDVARGFDVAEGILYFSEETTRSIQKVPADGGEPTIVATFTGYPYRVVSNGSLVYATLQDLDPETNVYSSHVVRMNVDGSDVCVVGSTSNFGDLVLYEDSAFFTGQCGTNGAK